MTKNRLADVFMHAWMRRGWLACLLWPVSLLFGLLLRLRLLLYRCGWLQQHRLGVPVIVVGNIFIGGTGKTPLTIWLLKQLKQAGYRPGVISRGYGSRQTAPCIVSEQSQAAEVGDEPLLIAQHSACPVVVGRNRVLAGQTLLAAFPDVDVIVSDDGLQHLALQRDVEIILFDSRLAGNGWLLPAGPLREPVGRRRDVTVVNLNEGEVLNSSLPPDTVRMQLSGNCAVRLTGTGEALALQALGTGLKTGFKIIAAAGIGNPERFFLMLRKQGIRFETLPLPDHFDFVDNPFKNLTADMILITEKDAVKCRELKELADDARIWVVAVEAAIESGAVDAILKKLTQKRSSP